MIITVEDGNKRMSCSGDSFCASIDGETAFAGSDLEVSANVLQLVYELLDVLDDNNRVAFLSTLFHYCLRKDDCDEIIETIMAVENQRASK